MMFNIISHYRNAIIGVITYKNLLEKVTITSNDSEDAKKLDHSHIVSRNVKWYDHPEI